MSMREQDTNYELWDVRTKLRLERDLLSERRINLRLALEKIAQMPKYHPQIAAIKIMEDMARLAKEALEKDYE